MTWLIESRRGMYLPQIDLWLDPRFPVERAFVSHAHFDHMANHRSVVCSATTARLMQARMPAERQEQILSFGEKVAWQNDATMCLYPAGHIFGSAQLWVERQGESLLYTGDFKLRCGSSAEPAVMPRADVLLMETTFGLPRYTFPPADQVLSQITQFCRETLEDDETPVLLGYSLGKSQEIIKSLAASHLPIMLHPATYKLTEVYGELGVAFPPYRAFDLKEIGGHVLICPPQSNQSSWLRKIKRRKVAAITGWALDPQAIYRYQCDVAFPLSDHADYPDLLRAVELVQPRCVYTVHGFAAEFAQILRERGIEAWALGQSNQMEFSLPTPSSLPDLRKEIPLEPESLAEPNTFLSFAQAAELIRATMSKNEKIKVLHHYLKPLDSSTMGWAAVYFTGQPFPTSWNRALHLGWALIKRALLTVSKVDEATWRSTYARYRDSGETAESLLHNRCAPQPLLLTDLASFFETLCVESKPLIKIDMLANLFRRITPLEAKYVVKIITGDLRIGLKEGLVEEALAVALQCSSEELRTANMLTGDLIAVVEAAVHETLGQLGLTYFRPVQSMLASPEPTAESIIARLGLPVWVEEKYDGIRCQIHKEGVRVELYSRELRCVTSQFPELARDFSALPFNFIIDGELLAWEKGRALPFAQLQKRLGRKGDDLFLGSQIPISYTIFDLLKIDNEILLSTPLAQRRTRLESLDWLPERGEPGLRIAATSASEIEAAFLHSRRRGNEGLMIKDPASLYTPGRRGLSWIKLKKAYATLDVVVVAVEYGHGKRHDVLSDYTFAVRDPEREEWLTIGKAYTGLTDAEIAQLTEHFLSRTTEVVGRVHRVLPDTVIEVAFDLIQSSKRHNSGLALRFPRIVRLRPDKRLHEVDTIEHCRILAAGLTSPAQLT
jgi:DNA ligase-1